MGMLSLACQLQSDGYTEADVTVQTRWDADRLDLGHRATPPRYLCAKVAGRGNFIGAAYRRSHAMAFERCNPSFQF
jgi:hypothetical protein